MHWSFVPAWVCVLAASSAQTAELAPELVTLARIKARMVETLARQPNYTCVQQVERSHRRAPKRKFELQDLLRIEVALVDGNEMYAWPGSRKFEDTDLTRMISGGAIGTGNFATHARAVFQSSAPRFLYVGPELLKGRQTVRFDYVVPLLTSGYRIRVAEREAVVGYHGSFWADAENYELAKLEVVADDIPTFLGVSAARDTMEYGRARIGASEFLLPLASELVMVDLQNNESRNRTQFTACRQYSGESVLTFAEAPDGNDEEKAEIRTPPTTKSAILLPLDIAFEVRLATEIDSTRAAVGDAVVATLDENIKMKRQVLVPKGAKLAGRIARLERRGEFTILDLLFSELDSETVHAELAASIDRSSVPFVNVPGQSLTLERRTRLETQGGIAIRTDRFRLRVGHRLRLLTHAPSTP